MRISSLASTLPTTATPAKIGGAQQPTPAI
jgi:hypothetical protein